MKNARITILLGYADLDVMIISSSYSVILDHYIIMFNLLRPNLKYAHHKCYFYNTTFVNCHQKARRKEAGQAALHEYYAAKRIKLQFQYHSFS